MYDYINPKCDKRSTSQKLAHVFLSRELLQDKFKLWVALAKTLEPLVYNVVK